MAAADRGRDAWSPLLAGLGRQLATLDAPCGRAEINGQPGAMFLDSGGAPDERLHSSTSPTGAVQTVRSVINPAKLGHLGPLADVREMLHDRAERRR